MRLSVGWKEYLNRLANGLSWRQSKHRPRRSVGLGDRDNLQLLTGCTDHIPDSFAHQRLCHRGREGN
jgi:hypothetical protein